VLSLQLPVILPLTRDILGSHVKAKDTERDKMKKPIENENPRNDPNLLFTANMDRNLAKDHFRHLPQI